MEWRSKLDFFFDNFEWKADVAGILVFGSQITGGATIHSDLDVHFIFDEKVDFRQQGNRNVEGLLIEYFANPPRQIRKYFEDDIATSKLKYVVEFASGEVHLDRTGIAADLKNEAIKIHKEFYEKSSETKVMSSRDKYKIWNMKHGLQAYKLAGRLDIDFVHHLYLDRLVALYMDHISRPYSPQLILGGIDDDRFRKKYMWQRLPDPAIAELIASSVTTGNIERKLSLFVSLADKILEKFGGFEIDGFRSKIPLDL